MCIYYTVHLISMAYLLLPTSLSFNIIALIPPINTRILKTHLYFPNEEKGPKCPALCVCQKKVKKHTPNPIKGVFIRLGCASTLLSRGIQLSERRRRFLLTHPSYGFNQSQPGTDSIGCRPTNPRRRTSLQSRKTASQHYPRRRQHPLAPA